MPPERLVYTFEFEGMLGHVLLETVNFEELDGKTKMTVKDVFQSVEDRDSMLKSGMEIGAIETLDRFSELLKELWEKATMSESIGRLCYLSGFELQEPISACRPLESCSSKRN